MPINKPQLDLESDHIKHQVDLLRLSEDANRRIRPILTGLQRELLAELAMQDLSAYRRQRLDHLLSFANTAIEASYNDISTTMDDFNVGVAQFEDEFYRASIQRAVGIELGTLVTAEQLSAIAGDALILGNPTSEWWSRQSARSTQRISDELKIGFLEGEGTQALGRRVRRVSDLARRDAEALAITSVQSVSYQIRDELIKANSDLAQGYISVATLDNRTTPICISLDGLKWDMNKQPVGHNKQFRPIPRHWRCRSTIIPWLKSFKDLSHKIQQEVPEGTRASMNGQVPQSMSYNAWLKTQSKQTQIDLLGVKRRELWLKGRLSLRQLTNQQGRPLTLEQLRERGV